MKENINVFVELDKKEFGGKYNNFIAGSYEIMIPIERTISKKYKEDYEIVKEVKALLGLEVIEINISNKKVTFKCYEKQDNYKNGSVRDIYKLKNEIENKVKERMNKANINKYDLIIKLTVLN